MRVDDRGVGGSTGNVALSTSLDFCGDVLTGVDFLKTRKEINSKHIGLIGHSEGGIIAPMAATANGKDIAYIVLMAAPGQPIDELLLLQGRLCGKAAGATDADIAKNQAISKQVTAILKQEADIAVIRNKFHELATSIYTGFNDSENKDISKRKKFEELLDSYATPWFHFFINYDPRPTLNKVDCPVLAINGGKDLQVSPKENLRGIEKALIEGANKDFIIKEFPKLNHMFQHCRTGSPFEYATIKETIAPNVLQTIGDWIIKRTVSPS